jgi:hypothetical protein
VRTLWRIGPYALAYVLFIGIGVAQPNFLLSWAVGIPFLVIVAWGIPALGRLGLRALGRAREDAAREAREAVGP